MDATTRRAHNQLHHSNRNQVIKTAIALDRRYTRADTHTHTQRRARIYIARIYCGVKLYTNICRFVVCVWLSVCCSRALSERRGFYLNSVPGARASAICLMHIRER